MGGRHALRQIRLPAGHCCSPLPCIWGLARVFSHPMGDGAGNAPSYARSKAVTQARRLHLPRLGAWRLRNSWIMRLGDTPRTAKRALPGTCNRSRQRKNKNSVGSGSGGGAAASGGSGDGATKQRPLLVAPCQTQLGAFTESTAHLHGCHCVCERGALVWPLWRVP